VSAARREEWRGRKGALVGEGVISAQQMAEKFAGLI
jgi:hypothetical protein